MKALITAGLLVLFAWPVLAQQPAQDSQQTQQPQAAPQVKHAKPLVFMPDQAVLVTNRDFNGNIVTRETNKTSEFAKDFPAVCPGAALTIKEDKADYEMRVSRNSLLVVNTEGTTIFTDKPHAFKVTPIKKRVAAACEAIEADWNKQ